MPTKNNIPTAPQGQNNTPTNKLPEIVRQTGPTPAQAAWARLPRKYISEYYRNRGFLEYTALEDEQRHRINTLRYTLSIGPTSLYPYRPDNWNESRDIAGRNDRELRVQESRRAVLHEMIDELAPDDLWSVFDITALMVRFPVDWPGHLAPLQQAHDRQERVWLEGARVRLGL